jgi:tetratricopeptide (TPR) repeat protein
MPITSIYSQTENNVTVNERKAIIKKIVDSLEFYYVNYDIGKKIGLQLKINEKKGLYNDIKNPDTLAFKLTETLRSVNGDLHLSVSYSPKKAPNSINNNNLDDHKQALAFNYGVPEVKILNGNIGYMKIISFSNWNFFEKTKSVMITSMKFLENSDAIIFDVRDNRGGVPNLVAFLCSYLFNEKVHLAQYYHRYRNDGYGLYTYKYIPGKRLAKVPVFILVNDKSASAAEEFAYFLKHQKRATVIGQSTMGAGYGVMSHRLNDRFVVYISSEEDINPITKTNFEGVGVIPNIKTKKDSTFNTAKSLAEKAAIDFRTEKFEKLKTLMNAYSKISKDSNISEIINTVKQSQEEGLIGRTDINSLGYKYLKNNPEISEVVFQLNTKLYPISSNVYDSYGDSLKALSKLEEALGAYKKAVEIGELIGSSNIAIYQANIKDVEESIAKKNNKN